MILKLNQFNKSCDKNAIVGLDVEGDVGVGLEMYICK